MNNYLRVARVHFKTASASRVGPTCGGGEGRACRRGSVGTQRRGLPAATDLRYCSASGCKASRGARRPSGHRARAGSLLFKSGRAENTCGLAGCSVAMAVASRGEPEPAPPQP